MKTTVELFTSPTCPYCPAAREVAQKVASELKQNGEEIELNVFDVSTSSGSIKATEYGITHVPDIVVYTDPGKKILIEGTPLQSSLEKAIRISQGKETVQEKKGFLSSLRSMLK